MTIDPAPDPVTATPEGTDSPTAGGVGEQGDGQDVVVGRSAAHRFNNGTRYRTDDHEMQRQLTPRYVLDPVRQALGSIDLDPCTEPDNPCGAERFYTAETDGAEEPWDARTIYCNPPYSKARERWVKRCIQAAEAGSRVILLMPSHTDTRLFHLAVESASHVVFIKGRVKFGVLRSNRRQEAASHPSCLIGWNLDNVAPLAALGAVWDLDLRPHHPARSVAMTTAGRPEAVDVAALTEAEREALFIADTGVSPYEGALSEPLNPTERVVEHILKARTAALLDRLAEAEQAIERVARQHTPDGQGKCREDRQRYPCQTARALRAALTGEAPS